jgi:tetratricopeptide (TPR) repeat protein
MKKLFILMLLMNFATLSFAQTKATNKTTPKKPKIEDVLNQQVEMLNARIDSMTIVHQQAMDKVLSETKDNCTSYYDRLDNEMDRTFSEFSWIIGLLGILIPIIVNRVYERSLKKDINDQNKKFEQKFTEQKEYIDRINNEVKNYEKQSKINSLLSEAQTILEKNPQDAVKLYTQILVLDKNNEVALLWRGIAYSLLSKSTDALADLNAALAINPRLARAYNNIGNVYAADERYELAEINYNKALEINPQYDVVYRNIALMYLNQDIHLDKAEYNLNKAISYNNEYIEAYITRAQMYRRMSERENNEDTKNKYKELALADMKQANRLKRNNESE